MKRYVTDYINLSIDADVAVAKAGPQTCLTESRRAFTTGGTGNISFIHCDRFPIFRAHDVRTFRGNSRGIDAAGLYRGC
ncbi:hypothetical protein CEPID_07230 [Corynebacterium epidermidicanis]|uniref:Uncharacterized protein n=1 Tax=Corynebacterium epidermidicanis TaxID=1050174 RepID=A0A0G3GWT1_9CORY|nr:hypothetical protein CEPID_07230 [Corynebacterium epidermidicanis]